jgi:hypothetical protein
MFDPEQTKTPILSRDAKPNFSQSPIAIPMSEKDRLRFYLINCSGTRKYFGFEMNRETGKLVLADKKKLERLDAETKSVLRELYLELGEPTQKGTSSP